MKNKELIDSFNSLANEYRISERWREHFDILFNENSKALQDAEGEIEVRKKRNLKDADEINRLKALVDEMNDRIDRQDEVNALYKAKLSEQVDPVEVIQFVTTQLHRVFVDEKEANAILEQFKNDLYLLLCSRFNGIQRFGYARF